MLTLIDDEGWDDEITSSSSKGYKAIRENLINDGLVQHYKGNTYIYITSMNKWSVLISAETQRQLCDMTGGESASVSYLAASLPFIGFVEKHARRVSSIPPSICIGTRRLRILQKDDKLELTECNEIASVKESLDGRVSGLCDMPCSFTQIPQSWSPGGTERLLKYIRVLFLDQVEFNTILWVIGSIAVDPSSISKFLLLYGPGGTGKSTIIRMIEDIFNGCCGTINSSTITSKSSTVSTDTARTIASNRVVTAGDINLETSQLNLHTIKEITGHDSLSIPPIKVRTRCTLIAASNNLPHPTTQPTWCSTATSRRIMVVPMNVKTSLIPNKEMPDLTEDCINVLLTSVSVYLNNKGSPPMSMRSLMWSVLGAGFAEIENSVEFDTEVDIQDIVDANIGIEGYFKLETHSLGELAFSMCPNSVIEQESIYYIKDIKLTKSLTSE